jgi:hypothetical protein
MIHPDDYGFTYATDSDWDRAEATDLGMANPERAWVLTDRDVWHPNPWYSGPPVPHPEDYDPDEDGAKPTPESEVGFDHPF